MTYDLKKNTAQQEYKGFKFCKIKNIEHKPFELYFIDVEYPIECGVATRKLDFYQEILPEISFTFHRVRWVVIRACY